MRIKIVETAEGVRVELAMAPGSTEFGYDIYGYQKKIEAGWGQLAEELWRRLEGSVQAPP